MRLLVRCDASAELGAGHAIRCLALAEHADAALFAMRTGAPLISARGFTVETIAPSPEHFFNLANKWRPDWIVIDLAKADSVIQSVASIATVLQLDDAGFSSVTAATLVLNPNVDITPADYPAVAAPKLLLGPRYSLLRRIFVGVPREVGGVSRIFVGFGGSDPPNLTQRIITPLATLINGNYEMDVVVGPENLRKSAILTTAARYPHVNVHIDPPNLAGLIARCDLAVIPASSMLWEVMAVGTPCVALAIVDNQRRNLAWLASNGVGQALGWHLDVPDRAIVDAVRDLLNNAEKRREMAERGRKLVDGRGVERVIDIMRSTTAYEKAP
jgi:UDP-2,4-diacetamido-2,4,6-trideoxy-beta-L-altropyranose hydrolase